jgi:SH3-like domain-containing protein
LRTTNHGLGCNVIGPRDDGPDASAFLAIVLLAAPVPVAATEQTRQPSSQTLPVPRFVSLKADRVNLRQGPSTDHPIAWVYQRAGLPMEVLREFDGWRQIRDSEGVTGWVQAVMLSGRRTALVQPWESPTKPQGQAVKVALRTADREAATPRAFIEAGVIANVLACDGTWCHVSVSDIRGYIEQVKLWGVYQNEVVK